MALKQIDENLVIDCGELVKSIISFIRETRNKHNIPKDKLILYIDLLSKNVELTDLLLMKFENIISKGL